MTPERLADIEDRARKQDAAGGVISEWVPNVLWLCAALREAWALRDALLTCRPAVCPHGRDIHGSCVVCDNVDDLIAARDEARAEVAVLRTWIYDRAQEGIDDDRHGNGVWDGAAAEACREIVARVKP